MIAKEQSFSNKALAEFKVLSGAVEDILSRTTQAFGSDSIPLSMTVEPLEEVINKLNKEMKKRHVKRLRKGKCSVEMGFVLSDLSANFARISAHCSNVAIGIIQREEEDIEAHEYLDALDKGENTEFRENYLSFKEKYVLP